MKDHSLVTTLKSLRGNPRGCVYTEPLWGIPFNLYIPLASLYMVALHVTYEQIGLIAGIGTGFQVIMALLSGVITDRLGRRRTTLIFDIVSWSVPALISAIAQNFWFFLIAAIVNSVWRVTQNSWTCLLVEDAEPEQLVDIYSWIYISNQLVGFVAPLAGVLMGAFSLIPTMRGLYLFAAVMFTVKAITTYRMTRETGQGTVRLHETKHQSSLVVLRGYGPVLGELLRTPQTLYTAGIMLVLSIGALISGNFWAILVTQKLQVPEMYVTYFPFLRSAVMIAFFFLVMPRIGALPFRLPLVAGFLLYVISQVLLITAPVQGYGLLIASVFLEACSYATVAPLVDRLTALTIEPKERARIQSILYVGIILLTTPFGFIAGWLFTLDQNLPFFLNMALFGIGALLAYLAGKAAARALAAGPGPAEVSV